MTDSRDKAWVKQAVSGNSAAFSQLIEAHYMTIYKIAYKWCGKREDAQDITQEICVRLPEKLSSFKGNSTFVTWLYRLTINATKDYYRKSGRIAGRELAFTEGFDVASSEVPADEKLMAEQEFALVRQLPEAIYDAVLLVFAEGMSHGEAARVLGCAETTISWRIFQARRLLKERVSHVG
ncbi:MAG: RNA polymerase sigma factor [Rickettsiales bacterium]|nr:RNA polymerase sigma factor [Rickettsiales bacterium]